MQEIAKNQETCTLTQILKTAFPQLNWTSKGSYLLKKSQYMLKQCIEKLIKDVIVLEEYKHPNISNLELDFFLPQYKIAFEYQVSIFSLYCGLFKGPQHYKNVNVFHQNEPVNILKQRDLRKMEMCKELGKKWV